jgi:hypothetical protein
VTRLSTQNGRFCSRKIVEETPPIKTARRTLVGIELMHMLKKGQLVAEERAQHLTPAEQVYSLAA